MLFQLVSGAEANVACIAFVIFFSGVNSVVYSRGIFQFKHLKTAQLFSAGAWEFVLRSVRSFHMSFEFA